MAGSIAVSGNAIIVKLAYISASLERLILYLNPTLVFAVAYVCSFRVST
jgi:hypothetical protein